MSKTKKNKFQYFLLPIAIIVWGYIIYKIFFYVERVEQSSINEQIGFVEPVEVNIPETYTLLNNYRDPFSSDFIALERDTSLSKLSKVDTLRSKNKTDVVSHDEITCPKIVYKGCILNREKSIEKAFIQIDGSTFSVSTGDTVFGVLIEKLFTDSLIVSFNENIYTFHKAYEY